MKAIELLAKIPDRSSDIKFTRFKQFKAKQYAEKHDGLYVGSLKGTKHHFNHAGLEGSPRQSLIRFIDWILNSNSYRANWIRSQITSNAHKGKTVFTNPYYIEDNHAVVLHYLFNNWEKLDVKW